MVTANMSELTDRAAGLEVNMDGGIAIITLARPERRNAMTPSMWHGLARIGQNLPADIRVVVVKGAGPDFCAGIDLRTFSDQGVPGEPKSLDPADPGFEDQVAGYQAGYTWLRSRQFVSIAAVQGHAIGAGFQLALSCDMRVLTDTAKLCMKEPELGLVPDLTGTKPLVELVGLPRAIELCLTARTIEATEAERLGLADYVVPEDGLRNSVGKLAAELLRTDVAAARETKALLLQARSNSLEEQAAAERAAQAKLLRSRKPDPPAAEPS